MTTFRWSVLAAALVVGNALTAFLVLTHGETARETISVDDVVRSPSFQRLESSVAQLEVTIQTLRAESGEARRDHAGSPDAVATGDAASGDFPDLIARLGELEKKLTDLQRKFEAFEVSTILRGENPDFAADDGFVHADALADAGKPASAAEGYLEFLENHPDHPDFHDIAHKARSQLLRAEYVDQAIDLQKELIEKFPERQEENYETLAAMEKNAGRYDDAIEHLEAAIERTSHTQTGLWRQMYRAWYVQLRDGDAAGLEAYREVERTRESLGVNNEKMKKKLADKIREAEGRLRAADG